VVGVPMDLYRLNDSSVGNVIQDSNYLLSLPVDREPMKRGDPAYESSSRTDVFWFDVMLNGNVTQLGDILVLNDPYYGTNYVATPGTDEFVGFCMAAESPIKNYLAARLNFYGQIFRPQVVPNASGYWDQTVTQELPLLLVDGNFVLGQLGQTASLVPMGSMPFRNRGEIYSAETANMPQKEQRFLYVPPLPGFELLAGDRILTESGSHYVLQSNYHQGVGTVGYQFLIEKLVSGSGDPA
jgi:hypothetical protein